ncbi:transcriptional regulator with XRE-family HTH domain [Rhizorhapis suberifaciens]|uniref:Transcriptional regulator with XRE-family HTH domain n=2 Tax=Rhizorhapis suberifaciens TaxID=13656 RepID=A0A840HXG1_9SPHN|nr:transcriptional regulator with XRE-family HTH domain [Rhizorhapis suberifaciens]
MHNMLDLHIRMRIIAHMDYIRAIRRKIGLSQAELGAALGLHQTSISRMETGDLPVDARTKLALDALLQRFNAGELGKKDRAA